MSKDLRDFLEKAKAEGEVQEIEGADWNLELGTITELVAEKENNGPALIFDKIKDYPQGYRVAANLYTTKRRIAIAMGIDPDTPALEIVKMWRGKGFKPVKPTEVKTGRVMENVLLGDEVNLLKFPVPWWHELDGGRYMGTGHVVIMKDPDEGWVNLGVQRAVVHDEKTLGLYISPGKHNRIIMERYFAKGQNCPVVMAFGPEPLTYLSGCMHVPWGISEFDWAGWMRKEPLEVMKGEFTGIPFPADDEIVIEGECINPDVEQRDEGPFGEWTGYYGGGRLPQPIVRVKALYHRDNPILASFPPLKPPIPRFGVPIVSAPAVWNDLENAGVTGIKGVWQLSSGGDRLLMVISIKQEHAGHAKQAAMVAAGGHGGGYMGKYIIVVDDDIDPANVEEVLWAIATRCEPENSIDILRDCWGTPLDPLLSPEKRRNKDYSHSLAIFNACRPFYWKNEFPVINKASDELRSKVAKKWGKEIGL